MATIQITIEMDDLRALVSERDELRRRIQELEATPLRFSLEKLAMDVCERQHTSSDKPDVVRGLTSDQRQQLRDAIRNYKV